MVSVASILQLKYLVLPKFQENLVKANISYFEQYFLQ